MASATGACAAYNSTSVNLFDNTFSSPVYQCPQNSYSSKTDCAPCPPGTTSRAGSTDASACFACPAYQYLNCTGAGCNQCPRIGEFTTFSPPGALHLSDCMPLATYTALLKGPIGVGSTSQAITPYRQGRPPHLAFNATSFALDLARLVSIPPSQVLLANERMLRRV